jgi:hypothetical protein
MSLIETIKKQVTLMKKSAADGLLAVEKHGDTELSKFRMSKCNECPHKKMENGEPVCGVCGCYLDIKIHCLTNRDKHGKVQITHCPIGRWDDAEFAETNGKINT